MIMWNLEKEGAVPEIEKIGKPDEKERDQKETGVRKV